LQSGGGPLAVFGLVSFRPFVAAQDSFVKVVLPGTTASKVDAGVILLSVVYAHDPEYPPSARAFASWASFGVI